MRRVVSAVVMLVSGAALTACGEPAPVESALAPFAYAASEYLASPLREQNAQGETHEEIVARCMKEQGFDYREADTESVEPRPDEEAGTAEDSSPFAVPDAATAGYGLVFPFSDFDEIEEDATAEPTPPPYDEVLGALTPAEVDAYTVALYGTYAGDLADDPDAAWDWTRAGCLGVADHELEAHPGRGDREHPYEELMAAIDELPLAIFDGDEWHAALASWSSCLSESGHAGFGALDEPAARIEEERDTLLESVRRPDSTEEMVTVTDATDGIPERGAWEDLRRREIALATADQQCREEADLDDEWQRLYSAAERRFLDRHRAELDAMMVWISENSD